MKKGANFMANFETFPLKLTSLLPEQDTVFRGIQSPLLTNMVVELLVLFDMPFMISYLQSTTTQTQQCLVVFNQRKLNSTNQNNEKRHWLPMYVLLGRSRQAWLGDRVRVAMRLGSDTVWEDFEFFVEEGEWIGDWGVPGAGMRCLSRGNGTAPFLGFKITFFF